MTVAGRPHGFRVGLSPERSRQDHKVGTFHPPPTLREWMGQKVEMVTNGQCSQSCLHKNPKGLGLENQVEVPGGGTPRGMKAPHTPSRYLNHLDTSSSVFFVIPFVINLQIPSECGKAHIL